MTGTDVVFEFDGPVSLKGIPQWETDTTHQLPTSAVQTAPNTISVHYASAIVTDSAVNVPFEDPAVRNAAGGYYRDSTIQIAGA